MRKHRCHIINPRWQWEEWGSWPGEVAQASHLVADPAQNLPALGAHRILSHLGWVQLCSHYGKEETGGEMTRQREQQRSRLCHQSPGASGSLSCLALPRTRTSLPKTIQKRATGTGPSTGQTSCCLWRPEPPTCAVLTCSAA